MFFAAAFGALLRDVVRLVVFAFTVDLRAVRRLAGAAKVAVSFCLAVVRRRLTRRLLAGDLAALGLLRVVLLRTGLLRAVFLRAVVVRRLLGLLRAVLLRAVLRLAVLFFAFGAVFFALAVVLRALVVRVALLRAVLFRDEVRDVGACLRAVVERFVVRRRFAPPVFVVLFVFTGMRTLPSYMRATSVHSLSSTPGTARDSPARRRPTSGDG